MVLFGHPIYSIGMENIIRFGMMIVRHLLGKYFNIYKKLSCLKSMLLWSGRCFLYGVFECLTLCFWCLRGTNLASMLKLRSQMNNIGGGISHWPTLLYLPSVRW